MNGQGTVSAVWLIQVKNGQPIYNIPYALVLMISELRR